MIDETTVQPTEKAELELLRLIGERSELSQREVASSLGMSLGKANYVLRALIEKGFVKAENYRKSQNKMAYLYLLTPTGIAAKADLTRKFLARKLQEYEELRVEIEQLKEEDRAGANRG
jgi:MarR family transcriptional regulator, temperature-dependent positive regulator of motility